MFARIRIGMSQEEAVAVLRTYDPYKIDGAYSEGTTKQGHSWTRTDECYPVSVDQDRLRDNRGKYRLS